jgi:hypothetical protein
MERISLSNKPKKETKDLTELEPYSVKVWVEGLDLEIYIHGHPTDVVLLSGYIIAHLREKGTEPSVVILP